MAISRKQAAIGWNLLKIGIHVFHNGQGIMVVKQMIHFDVTVANLWLSVVLLFWHFGLDVFRGGLGFSFLSICFDICEMRPHRNLVVRFTQPCQDHTYVTFEILSFRWFMLQLNFWVLNNELCIGAGVSTGKFLMQQSSRQNLPLLICIGFLKYPFGHLFQTEIKIDCKTSWNFFFQFKLDFYCLCSLQKSS